MFRDDTPKSLQNVFIVGVFRPETGLSTDQQGLVVQMEGFQVGGCNNNGSSHFFLLNTLPKLRQTSDI